MKKALLPLFGAIFIAVLWLALGASPAQAQIPCFAWPHCPGGAPPSAGPAAAPAGAADPNVDAAPPEPGSDPPGPSDMAVDLRPGDRLEAGGRSAYIVSIWPYSCEVTLAAVRGSAASLTFSEQCESVYLQYAFPLPKDTPADQCIFEYTTNGMLTTAHTFQANGVAYFYIDEIGTIPNFENIQLICS